MTARTPDEVYASLIAAGWQPQPAITMTAIAGAESGWNDTSLGDTALEDTTWGSSFGLYQIRTLKADTGTGSNRDIARLSSGDVQQAQAALAIYQGAQSFRPWTVYNTGAYQQYLAQAQAAAARVGTGGGGGGGGGDGSNPFPTVGPTWLPWNWLSDAGNAANSTAQTVLTGARHIVIEGVAVVAGLGLIVIGLHMLGAPNPLIGDTGAQRKGRKLVGQLTGLGGGS